MPYSIPIGLILGSHQCDEVQFIYKEIERLGNMPIIIDTTTICSGVQIEYSTSGESFRLVINGVKISIDQISGVYWNTVNNPTLLQQATQSQQTKGEHIDFLNNVVTQPSVDAACLMHLLFAQTNLNWVNSFKGIGFHRLKPMQLSLAKRLGAVIPHTYIGCCHQSIASFLQLYPTAIIKPVFAGGHTKRIPASLCSFTEIEKWANYPVTLQAFIPGDNIRTYVVGQFMISAKIIEIHDSDAPTLVCDYREASSVELQPFVLPIEIQQLSVRIMRAFHLQYTAIDWRLTPQNEFVFLEANPAPHFVAAQQQLGVSIDRAIVDLMFG